MKLNLYTDDITKLSRTVLRIRALQKQIALRKELLKDNADAKQLLKDTDALGKIASATGGKFYLVQNAADISGVFLDAIAQRK